jgi:hypothetical protein
VRPTRRTPAGLGGAGDLDRIARLDPADDAVDDAGAGGEGGIAKHLVEGAAGHVEKPASVDRVTRDAFAIAPRSPSFG